MTTTTPTASRTILETARTAAEAGDTLRARRYFRNATEIDPTSIEAWLGLAAATAVLHERRGLYERALALDPTCREAREGIAQIDELLAAGALIRPKPAHPSGMPSAFASPAAPDDERSADAPPQARPAPHASRGPSVFSDKARVRSWSLRLLGVGVAGLATMGLLTTLGIFVLTSFWGFLLAFLAGPSVSELMLRLTARARKGLRGRPLQIAGALGMILGGLAAMALGGLLLQLIGAPLPAEAIAMARNSGVGADPAAVLLNNPGLLVFVSSAVAATVYRLR